MYDSGVGGVSVLRALQQVLPHETYVYVADSGHAPYGNRSQAFLEARAHTITKFLVDRGVKAIVLACNTVSVATASSLRAEFHLPIVAMEPAIKPAALATRSKKVLVLATPTTVESESVARLCAAYGANARIVLQGCPGLAECVERGELESPATETLLRGFVEPALKDGADTIVLGCTHYAFLMPKLAAIVGPDVRLVEPSTAVAQQLARRVTPAVPQPASSVPPPTFFTTGSADQLGAFLQLVGMRDARIEALHATNGT